MVFEDRRLRLVPLRKRKAAERRAPHQCLIAALTFGLLLAGYSSSPGEEPYSLIPPSDPLPSFQRVKAVLEVSGKLKLNADGKQVNKLPINVEAKLLYDQKTLAASADPTKKNDVRYYHQAEASLEVGSATQELSLSEDRRLLAAHTDSDTHTLFSPLGPLTRDNLELVDIPGDSAVLDRLLPDQKVRIGESWTHNDETIALLTGLDAIYENEAESTLRRIEGPRAIIDLKGDVTGAVGGVSSEMQLKATYNYHLEEHRVNWLALSIQEDRAIGHAEPGLDATARLRIAVSPTEEVPQLSEQALSDLSLSYKEGDGVLDFRSQSGGFRFLHSRGWHVMIDRHDVAILRLIDRGDLIAQCNASKLPKRESEGQLQMEAFQADVKKRLGENFGRFVEAAESTRDDGVRVLRTVVAGVVSELPVQWIYYHLSNEQGRQLAIVFTMDAELVERFSAADQMITSSLDFLDLPQSEDSPSAESNRSAAKPQEQDDEQDTVVQ